MLLPQYLSTNSHKQTSLKIYLRLHNGNGCQIISNDGQKMDDVLEHSQLRVLELPKSFKLTYKGKQITNYNLTLKDLGLRNNSIIHIETKQNPSKRQLIIDLAVFYNSDKFYIRIKKQKTIQQLKNKINRVIKILPKNQRLYFKSQILQNDRKIEQYHMKNDSLIYLKTQHIKEQNNLPQVPGFQSQNYVFQGNNSMIQHLSSRSFSISTQAVRSLKEISVISNSGYEVEIKQKQQNESFLMNEHNFNFKDFGKVSYESKETKEQLRSTQGNQEIFNDSINQQQEQCQINLDFSGRLMII